MGITITSRKKVLKRFFCCCFKSIIIHFCMLRICFQSKCGVFFDKPGFSELSAKIINFLELFKLFSMNEWNEYCKLDSFSIMKKLWIKLLMLLAEVNCRIASMNSQCYNLWLQINILGYPKLFKAVEMYVICFHQGW